MSYINNKYYGDETRWFVGVVEETNTDEPRLGRVRVRIQGVHGSRDEVPVSDLPYAQVVVPTTEAGVSGIGRAPKISVGAMVFGMFLDGKTSQLPLVLGSIPRVETPSNEQIDNQSNSPLYDCAIVRNGGDPYAGTKGSDGKTPSIKSALQSGTPAIDGAIQTKVTGTPSQTNESFSNEKLRAIIDAPLKENRLFNDRELAAAAMLQTRGQEVIFPTSQQSKFNVFAIAIRNGSVPPALGGVAESPALDDVENTRIEVAIEWFRRMKKYSHEQIAAIVGNLYFETKLDRNFKSDNRVGLFALDEDSPTYRKYLGFAKDNGMDTQSFVAQLGFVHTLINSDPKFRGTELYKKHTVKEASKHFQAYFLNELGQVRARVDQCNKIYNNFVRRPK